MAGELVLIVEDNEKNLKLARDLLEMKGYRVIAAGTAEIGVTLARGRFHEGDTSTEFYVVLQGSVDMATRDAATGQPRLIRTVRQGEFFGEMSCFCERPRAATAVVREEAVLLSMSQAAMNDLLA